MIQKIWPNRTMQGALLLALLCSANMPQAHAIPKIQEELKGSACSEKALEILRTWHAQEPWTPAIAHGPKERVLRTATSSLGKWVEVTLRNGKIHMDLFNQNSILSLELDKDCEAQARLSARRIKDRFANKEKIHGYQILRDEGIAKLFATNGPGVLFLWSPHYQISVEGLQQARNAAKKLNLPLYALVEPTSNPGSVGRVVKRLQLNPEHVFYLNSFDLQNRGMRLHFPSLIVFNHGKFTSQVRRGYEADFVFEEYFRNHL